MEWENRYNYSLQYHREQNKHSVKFGVPEEFINSDRCSGHPGDIHRRNEVGGNEICGEGGDKIGMRCEA